jgi:murein DD-endopeptidase MepM/ murein hydrolase activator NlpD
MKKPKKRIQINRNFVFFLLIPIIGVCLWFGFRKDVSDADTRSKLVESNIKVQQLTEENANWKKLYSEVYNIKEDSLSAIQEINDLLYFKNMPIGGQSDDPPIKQTDKLTVKMLQNTINSFKETQNSLYGVRDYLKARQQFISEMPFIYPLKKDGTVRVSSAFGFRDGLFNSDKGQLKFHPGVDLVANTGDPIISTADGVVEYTELNNAVYGEVVILKHKFNFETLYAHMSKLLVKNGQKIKRGDLIGLVGETGESTGPHLHYEIRIGGEPDDPMKYLGANY